MAAKLLTIGVNIPGKDPAAGRGEFDLVMVSGVEGISIPYYYDVRLFRKVKTSSGQAIPDINPREIINTVATIEINRFEDKFEPFVRTGIFEHFEKAGRGTKDDEFRVYTGRIVPAFKMLDREVLFRIFENQDVVTILEKVLKKVPNLEIDTRDLRAAGPFPKMEYCVQFGESTFAFLSRLMARFGIHYFFDTKAFSKGAPQNEVMVFGTESSDLNLGCLEDEVDIVADSEATDDVSKDARIRVTGFVQRFDPAYRSSTAGNFNILAPTKPFTAERKIDPAFDMIDPAQETPGPAKNFEREEFPAPFDSNEEAAAYVRHRQKQEEHSVATIVGRGGNRTFIAGRKIRIRKDAIHVGKDDKPEHSLEGREFLLEWLGFSALEPVEKQSVWKSVGEFVVDVLFKGEHAAEVTGGVVDHLLEEYLTKRTEHELHPSKVEAPDFGPTLLSAAVGGGGGALAGHLIPAIVHLIKPQNKVKFRNGFVASVTGKRLPLMLPAQGPRPNAYGPHLATVIGDDGIDTAKGDISADALGRVRVRFPWDIGLVKEGEHFDPFATGKNTCWVRVAQSWAGRNFGAQFLPRIGHEVVVEFIDGDPERPIITGSVYNADLGTPNLPFAAFKDGPKPFAAKDLVAHTGLGSFQRSGVKTKTTPTSSNDKQGFHMLRFDDTRGSEQLLVRSQGRYDLTAFRNHFDTTHGNRHVLVKGGKDDKGNTLGGSHFTTAGGELDLHVGKDRYEGIDGVAQLAVKADTTFDLQTKSSTMVGTTASLNATKIILEAQAKITLKVGGSFVVVDPCGVFIKGPIVQINSGGSPDSTTDVEMTDPVDATQADPGEPPNFLDLQPKGGGGARRKRTVKAKHGFVCSMNADGTIQVTKSIKVNASDPNYASAVIADLSIINNTKTGKAMLDDLDARSPVRTVTIGPEPPATPPNAHASPTDPTGATNGTGSDSTVGYNPGEWPSPAYRTNPPGDVVLFHELTHAQHNAHGTQDNTARTDGFTDNEEFNTIGPENQYRDERGHPRRINHGDL